METKPCKTKREQKSSFTAIRVKEQTKDLVKSKLTIANNREIGKKITPDQMIHFALSRLSDKDIKELQQQALSFTDKKKLLRKKYIEINGSITPDEFEGFTMSPDFQRFFKEHAKALQIA